MTTEEIIRYDAGRLPQTVLAHQLTLCGAAALQMRGSDGDIEPFRRFMAQVAKLPDVDRSGVEAANRRVKK